MSPSSPPRAPSHQVQRHPQAEVRWPSSAMGEFPRTSHTNRPGRGLEPKDNQIHPASQRSRGDEHGVQGRFQQSVGQVVGKILDAQGINAHFADFKCIGGAYHNTPDVILMNGNALEAIGELKVPWVDKHVIADAYDDEDRALRVLLAQPIQYMQDLNCMYGFLSNYDETIFIKQSLINGAWVVDYSPVIRASTTFVKPEPGNPLASSMVSVKQCFFHLASIAHRQGPVINTTPKPQWVIAT